MAAHNPSVQRFYRYILPVVVWAILIFIVSAVPGKDIPSLFSGQDVAFHLIEYAIFGYLIYRALVEYYALKQSQNYIFLTILIGVIYAVSDEFHQSFVPMRCPSVLDALVDACGITIGSWLLDRKMRSNDKLEKDTHG